MSETGIGYVLIIHFNLVHMDIEVAKVMAASFCMAIGSIGPALAEGFIAVKAMEAIGRNPASRADIVPNMIVAMAIVESVAIYALVVSLIIIFVA